MPTALITGVTGFTGRYMKDLLVREGYEVYGTANNVVNASTNIFSVDLRDDVGLNELTKRKKFDVVIHLAAMSHAANGEADAIYGTNIVGTRNLLNALYESGHQDCVILLVSSAHVYGNSLAEVLSEEEEPNPASDYAVSKLCMEYMANLWKGKLPIVTVRPFNYTGVGQSENFLIPKIVSHYRENRELIELGNIDISRDFSDVRAIVEDYYKLVKLAPIGEVFNVCSGKAYSLREILNIMNNLSGYEIEVAVNQNYVRDDDVKFLRGSNLKFLEVVKSAKSISFTDTLEWMYSN